MTPRLQPEWIIKEDELQKVVTVLRDEGCGQYAKILLQTIHLRPYLSVASGREQVLDISEVLNSLCCIDLWFYTRGDKDGDDVSKCRGVICNYCGRYNKDLRRQGDQR